MVIPPAIFFYYSTLFDSRFKTLQQNHLIKGNSLIKNMDFVLYLSVMYLFAWLILKYIKTSLLQFLVSFIASLTVLTLQMFSDGSYADYTSFIVVGGVALFLAFMMLIVIKALSKSSK
ncbi:transporter [Lactococcus lactis]|uniref:transporter n=1 Tax=Lactococcus lactis TaxID=1358 RepID=UPI0032E4E86C